jgi:threonine dehydrogenase-like Zn-dependent dehydrogenase
MSSASSAAPDLARCLIIGCGCRGLLLAAALRAQGHAVRGTTRDPHRRSQIEAAGVEPFVGDPDLIGTLARALQHVTVACVLLGSASGTDAQLAALHGTRLDMLLERMLDTTVRAVVYERSGTVPDEILAGGAERVRYACQRSLIPFALIEADPSDHGQWPARAAAAVQRALLDRAVAPG